MHESACGRDTSAAIAEVQRDLANAQQAAAVADQALAAARHEDGGAKQARANNCQDQNVILRGPCAHTAFSEVWSRAMETNPPKKATDLPGSQRTSFKPLGAAV